MLGKHPCAGSVLLVQPFPCDKSVIIIIIIIMFWGVVWCDTYKNDRNKAIKTNVFGTTTCHAKTGSESAVQPCMKKGRVYFH